MGTWKHFIANSLQNFGVYEKLITLWSDNLTMIRFPIPIRKITLNVMLLRFLTSLPIYVV